MDKIINLLINNWTKGVDTYIHNGSTWLIFTEQKSWVIELTESKTLWYNYNFFKELFGITSMDVVENQHYITKWVEDNIINKVKYTSWGSTMNERFVGDVIEDGVKETELHKGVRPSAVESTIQNGVKETSHNATMFQSIYAEDAIENGVKHTEIGWHQCNNIDDAIEYGVKETLFNQGHKRLTVKNIIENGVRHTLNTEYMPTSMVEDIIENGVKETKGHGFEQQNIIDDIVKDGVKETKTPGKDGDIMSTIEWMEENKSTSYTKMIDDIIENGVKETKVCNFLDPNTNLVYVRWPEDIEEVIDYGTKNPSV